MVCWPDCVRAIGLMTLINKQPKLPVYGIKVNMTPGNFKIHFLCNSLSVFDFPSFRQLRIIWVIKTIQNYLSHLQNEKYQESFKQLRIVWVINYRSHWSHWELTLHDISAIFSDYQLPAESCTPRDGQAGKTVTLTTTALTGDWRLFSDIHVQLNHFLFKIIKGWKM